MGPVAVAEPPGGERNDASPGLGSQFSRRRFELVLRARHDGDVHPFAGQLPRDGLANAEAAPGDDCVFALKPQVHRMTSLALNVAQNRGRDSIADVWRATGQARSG